MLPLTAKGFRIDANIEEATFYVNREDGGDMQVRSPSGKLYSSTDHPAEIKWFRGQKFDVVTILKPEVGDWRVEGLVSSEGFATVLTNLKLVTDWPASINVGNPVLLQARLYEADKPVVLPEMSGTTRFAAQIIPTDRVSEPILREGLYDDGTHGDKIARDGIFSYSITFDEPGERRLQIVANAPTFERRQQILFRVKPRIIELTVSDEESEGGHANGHGGTGHKAAHDSAASEEHAASSAHTSDHADDPHSDSAAPEASDKEEKKAEAEKILRGRYFLAELSSEASSLKEIEVKIVAIDKNRKRFVLPTVSVGEGVYRAPAAGLPHDGLYEVQANLSAERKRSKIKEESNKITFEKIAPVDGEDEVQIVVEKKPPEKESPILPLILLSIINIGAGAVSFVLLKKAQGQASFSVPEFAPLTDVEEVVAHLEGVSTQTEIDLNNPRFSEESVPKLTMKEAPAASADSAAQKPAVAGDAPAEEENAAPAEAEATGGASSEEAPAAEAPPAEDAAKEEEGK
jgi:uncharacterized protein (TIGR03503 family)